MKMLLKGLCIMIAATTLSASCKKSDDDNSNNGDVIAKDVAYANVSTAQKMDIYLPANRNATDTKVIIFIHGGGWNAGDKTDFNDAINTMWPSLKEYAIFNINYRLADGAANINPAQINDINTAIDFITSKAVEYKINPNVIGLVGASAGAHLALLKAYKLNADGRIKAVVDLFGPTDLTWMYNNHPLPIYAQPQIANFIGGTPTTKPTAYAEASPLNYVTATSPATQIFHGTVDPVVPISESQRLNAKLQTFGVPHEYITYAGEQHGWVGANLTDTYVKAGAFVKLYVK